MDRRPEDEDGEGLGPMDLDPLDGGGDDGHGPPVDARTGGGGSSRGPRVPRRDIRRYLPWIVLGASIIAFERALMVTFVFRDLSWVAYTISASLFITAVLFGAAVGGRAFYQAYHADQGDHGAP